MTIPPEHLGKQCIFIMIAGRLKGILHPKDMLESGYLYFLNEVLTSKLWKDYVHTDPILHAIVIESKENPLEYNFYDRYFYNDKLELLLFLINCVYETTAIYNDISERMDLKSNLTKAKIDLKSKLKKIRKKIKSIGKKGINYSRLLQEENALITKINEINNNLHINSVRTEPLGLDRHHNEYYVFQFKPDCIYVRRDEPVESEEEKSKDGYWYFYSSLEEITNLKNSLLEKGVRESALLGKLKSYIESYRPSDGKIKYEEKDTSKEHPNLQNIKGKMTKLEQAVMRYLRKKQKTWETEEIRAGWRKRLKGCTDTMEAAKLLLELAEKTSKPISLINSDSDSDHQNTDTELHRVPIKLWKYSRHCDSLWFSYVPLIHTDSQLNLAVHTFAAVFKNYVERREAQSKSEKRPREEHSEVCYICKDYGYLLCCDGCSRAVHPRCEGLKDVPKDTWYCKICREEDTNRISRRIRLS